MNLPANRNLKKRSGRVPRRMKFTYPSGSRPLEGYTIKRGVGRGGFGEVYFATSDAGKEVALKLIRRNLDVELRGVTQCLNLKHPNLIAPVRHPHRRDGRPVGDHGVRLRRIAGGRHRPPSRTACRSTRRCGGCAACARGVAYLHDHGIVHRDLKPGNIFSDEGTVKIGDYGLAKFISCSRRSGQTESVGTVHYMAPEIANGRYGREIDTYALGIILFEMLTGRVPFEGESVGEVLMKHLTAEPDLSALDEPYRDIVRRALAKDPNVRINSVGEIGGAACPAALTCRLRRHTRPPRELPMAAGDEIRDADAGIVREIRNADAAARRSQFASARLAAIARGSSATSIEEPIWKAIRDGTNRCGNIGMATGAAAAPAWRRRCRRSSSWWRAIRFFDDGDQTGLPGANVLRRLLRDLDVALRPSIKRQVNRVRRGPCGGIGQRRSKSNRG